MIRLKGITWNHTRGYLPMAATAQRFSELYPQTEIVWEKRSLQQFGDLAPDDLAQQFDLLVIDHPFIGAAAERRMLTPLEQYLPKEFLADQAANSVGKSNASYVYAGSQWALAIDAAAPISGWHADLLKRADAAVPSTWAEVLALAKRGLVAIPGTAIDTLMHFYMFCVTLGEEPLAQPGAFIPHKIGAEAFERLRELARLVVPECATRNPIAIWELMSRRDAAAYCPFAYGYSNYSREGYAAHAIQVGGLPDFEGHGRFLSVLGGAGLAISAHTRHREIALEYARFVADAGCQKHLYFDVGGQPGHRTAWQDAEVNRRCGGFFERTLKTLDEAWVRPRWDGYHQLQDRAAAVAHACVWDGEDVGSALGELDGIAREFSQQERTA